MADFDYKVGDLVRVDCPVMGYEGSVGTVTHVGMSAPWPLSVQVAGGRVVAVNADELELYEPEQVRECDQADSEEDHLARIADALEAIASLMRSEKSIAINYTPNSTSPF